MSQHEPKALRSRQRRPRLLRILVPLLVLLVAAATWVAAASLPTDTVRVVGGNLPVNEGASDPRDISSHNSPTLVHNPTDTSNLVVVNRVDTPMFSCGVHMSLDGGVSWRDATLPFPEGEEDPPRCFAPDAAFDADGTLHVSFVTLIGLGNTPNALWVASSSDGGMTFSRPTRVTGPLTFQARLAADPDRRGRLYLSWLQGTEVGNLKFTNPGNPVLLTRSDDNGRTWREPIRVSAPEHHRSVAPSVAVGPDNEVYVLYLDLRDDVLDYEGAHEGIGGEPYDGAWSLVLARSADLGDSWMQTVIDDSVVPTERVIVFFPPAPSLAIDRERGRIYVGFHDGRDGDPDIWLWSSTDGGVSFRPGMRINDTPQGDRRTQELAKLAVAPDGRLDVVYYDRRRDPNDVMAEVSFQSSSDGGRSFSPRFVLTDSAFDSSIGFGSERGMPDLGSRLGLASTDATAMAVWTDTRGGTEASSKQDLGRALVWFSPASPLRTPLRILSVCVGGLALMLLVSLPRRRTADKHPTMEQSTTPEAYREQDQVRTV